MNTHETIITDREIIQKRLLDAPRSLVWRAWTEPEHLKVWWGPDGFTNTFHEYDLRPGGVWRFMMHGPDGTDYPNKIVFEEVEEPSRIVYQHSDDEEKGDHPHCFHVTVTFEEQDGKTLVTLHSLFPTKADCDAVQKFGAIEGGVQTLGRLDQHLKTMR
jgi:uncharacterized protein YndB with AHSA1/START domain